MRFLLPEGIDPYHPSWGKGERSARIAYAAQIVSTSPYDQFRNFVSINSEAMKSIISSEGWCAARNTLSSELEICHKYVLKTHCKGYRWCKRMRRTECVEQILECPGFIKKLAAYHQNRVRMMSPVELGVYESMRLVNCTIGDVDEFLVNLPVKRGTHETHRRAVYRASIGRIEEQNYMISKPGKTGRMYHSLAQTPRAVRAHLTIAGEKAEEVDLHNSQPYFMASLFPELGGLAESVCKGHFYEDINANLEDPLDFNKPDERTNFKKSCLTVMYSKPMDRKRWSHQADSWIAKVERAMETTFPGLPARIEGFAGRHDPTAFAIAMQQRESGVFIGSVLPRLQAEGIPAVPIHDSFLCRQSDAELVRNLLEKALFRETRLKPCIS